MMRDINKIRSSDWTRAPELCLRNGVEPLPR